MANPNKAKGDRWESAVRDYLRANGFPNAERTRAGYAKDHGDVHLDGPTVIAQAKDHARHALPEWLTQLAEQTADAGAAHGFLAVKRRGVGDPGKSYAVMELAALVRLLRAAGYGDDPDSIDQAA